MEQQYYTLEVAGVTRQLPIMQVAEHLCIASFVILGDCELVTKAAPLLEKKLPEVVSITTQKAQTLCLDGKDAMLLKGKRVAIVDDVISTGESLLAIERLVEKAGGDIVARAAILAEGDAAKRGDIVFLEPLPLFPV